MCSKRGEGAHWSCMPYSFRQETLDPCDSRTDLEGSVLSDQARSTVDVLKNELHLDR